MRYRLDELGWFQFEALMTSLLKAELGLGIESWSAKSGDNGRDAFFAGSLPFPTKTHSPGPFLFQAKFSTALDRTAALRRAVRAEAVAIQRRMLGGQWQPPRHYCLITNVELTPTSRNTLETELTQVVPAARVSVLGGSDVCASLDRHPHIRRSFPQLLGLADLTSLIEDALSREQRQRSDAAIGLATRYADTFVPTGAYDRAWSVLREHHFAVLCGPPEMGKTTIAWIVALSQVASGWEAFFCRTPSDFFEAYHADRSQVFVADDAFGRTEYDPGMVLAWERDLHLIWPKLDKKHWLVWTSRKHLLERARQKMDLQQPASRFPDPGSIIIESSRLTKTEKALILYRHSKNHLGEQADREVVKAHCQRVIGHPAFTPERIRNFVSWLPTSGVRDVDFSTLTRLIHEVIENPTNRMKRAYASLHPAHKWVLVALLETPSWATSKSALEDLYQLHCPSELREPFEAVLDQLVDAFIHQSVRGKEVQYSWIHPSYRDLVIDELSSDDAIKKRFLSSTHLAGVSLAVSGLGGAVGGRRLPLLRDLDDWRLFRLRLRELVPQLPSRGHASLLTDFSEALETETAPDVRQELLATLSSLCDDIRLCWDGRDAVFTAAELLAYADASRWLDRIPQLPSVAKAWSSHVEACSSNAELAFDGAAFEPDALTSFADLVSAVQHTEPRFLAKVGFPSSHESLFAAVERALELEVAADISLSGTEEVDWRASQFDEFASSLSTLGKTDEALSARFSELRNRISAAAERLRRDLDYEPEPDDDGRPIDRENEDVARIFSDL